MTTTKHQKNITLQPKTKVATVCAFSRRHWFISIIVLMVVAWFVYALVTPASNLRNWQSEYQVQSRAMVTADVVSIIDIRNQSYTRDGPSSLSYYNQTFNVSDLQNLTFYVVSLSDFKGIAHTFFEFTFVNGSKITVSVEARRQAGEEYSVWFGMLRSYEVFYVWSPITDSVARRQIWQRPQMIRYQIKADTDIVQTLFMQLIEDTNNLQEHPRYYNTLFSSCTSNLLDAARKAYPHGLPWTISRFLPGYATEYLYDLDLINTNLSLEDLETSYLPVG